MEHSANMQGHGHPGGHPGGMPQGNGIMPPFLVSYSVTRECNLRCKHCYSESSDNVPKDELTTEQAFRLLDEIVSWGPKLLIFDGGEPLKRADFFDLAKHASSRGIRTVIGTNATLIDRNVAQKLKDCGVMAAQISVDGANDICAAITPQSL
ncbi:MAG TPA: radical SAM protein, partial [Caldisericia bacterium]|nr:radical SAM protein [Caldisericia bacterium]